MYVPWPMEKVEHLQRLGDGAEQRIVAACAFLLLVKANCGAFRVTFRRLNRSIEVESDAGRSHATEAREDHLSQQTTKSAHGLGVRFPQHTADGGHVGESLHPQETFTNGSSR